MQYKFLMCFLATWTFALATAATLSPPEPLASSKSDSEEDQDSSVAESNLLSAISALQPPSSNNRETSFLDDFDSYPYEGPRQNIYGTFAAPQPSIGVSINTKALLAPQVEVLRLVEAFIRLKGELLARFQALINDNYDLIRAVLNLVISKITSLHTFSLKGISVLRKILEFALTVFADWSVTLPSVTFGATSYGGQPQEVYGIPAGLGSAVASFTAGLGK